MVETGRSRPTREDKALRAAKQQKVSHMPQRGMERADTQPLESQAWLPAPMLGGEPLREDASLRDFNGGIGCHIALAMDYFQRICPSYGISGRMKSSSIAK